MSQEYNRLLKRQIRKFLGNEVTPEMEAFLEAVNTSYNHYEKDRKLLERSMDLSSKELLESNVRIRLEAEKLRDTKERVRRSEQMLKSINANIRDAIYRSTPDKGLVYANQAFAELFGFDTVEEALKVSPQYFYKKPEIRDEIRARISEHGVLKGEEVLFVRKDGSTFWGLISTILINDPEIGPYYDGAIIDITDRKINEEVLKSTNSELQKINTELDRFVYSASHDLRAPLTSMLGLTDLILLEAKDDAIIEYTNLIQRSVQKMDSFIHDIIDYSSNARLEATWEAVNLNELIQNTIDNLRYMPGADSIQTVININQELQFFSDPKRLDILFSNLISNSIKYHNLGQTCPEIRIETQVTSNQAVISFSDNGIGIESNHLENIFDMFYRASTRSTGTGLGLYIVKETVEKLSGQITVSSEFGKGTSFAITIPNQLN